MHLTKNKFIITYCYIDSETGDRCEDYLRITLDELDSIIKD